MSIIRLKLCSDLCAGSGRGYGHLVDSDICYDSLGLPYIPARRLKGCLRAAAEYIDMPAEVIDTLFGVQGSGTHGALLLENGVPAAQSAYEAEIRGNQALNSVTVLDFFTSVRDQTAIDRESGTAKENSLRATRVLNRALDGETLEFVFPCSVSACETELQTICSALRHMGTHRTRGLGAVRCSYEPGETRQQAGVKAAEGECMTLLLKTETPLFLPGSSDSETVDYISGAVLRGGFARLYLLENPADERFEALFLSGKLKFGNLCISDENGKKTVPSPAWLLKLKMDTEPGKPSRDGEYITAFSGDKDIPQGKSVREKYVDEALRPVDVLQELVYHHQHSGDKLLYYQNVISAGQYFRGELRGSREDLDLLGGLLRRHTLRLGKSKTAQYAAVRLVSYAPAAAEAAEFAYKKGDELIYQLESDVILCDENGINGTEPELLLKQLPGYAVKNDDPCAILSFGSKTALSYKTLQGYNAKRNLRNLPQRAFAMGSVITLEAAEDGRAAPCFRIGLRQAEGFGVISCKKAADIRVGSVTEGVTEPKQQSGTLTKLLRARQAREAAIEQGFALSSMGSKDLTASFIGRLLLMLEQSADAADFKKRISGISDQAKQSFAENLLKKSSGESWELQRLTLNTALRLIKYANKEKAQ